MSAMTILTTNEFKIHGNVNIRIEKLNIIKDSDQDLLKTSDSITYPTSTLVLDPYDTIYIDLESNNPEVEVGIVVLFVLSTDPLPVGYAIEPENQAEIKSLFSNINGQRIIFADQNRQVGIEYADVNMQGYKNVYATLISRKNDVVPNAEHIYMRNAGNIFNFRVFFQTQPSTNPLFMTFDRQKTPVNNLVIEYIIRLRKSLNPNVQQGVFVNPTLRFRELPTDPNELYTGAVDYTITKTESSSYIYITAKVEALNISDYFNRRFAHFQFEIDGTNSVYADYTDATYQLVATNQAATGQAKLTFEINANDIWVELEDLPVMSVTANEAKTNLIGEYSNHILPSGYGILRARLETETDPLRTEVVLLRV